MPPRNFPRLFRAFINTFEKDEQKEAKHFPYNEIKISSTHPHTHTQTPSSPTKREVITRHQCEKIEKEGAGNKVSLLCATWKRGKDSFSQKVFFLLVNERSEDQASSRQVRTSQESGTGLLKRVCERGRGSDGTPLNLVEEKVGKIERERKKSRKTSAGQNEREIKELRVFECGKKQKRVGAY